MCEVIIDNYYETYIQSEDKKFKPIDQIEGPLLALLYLVRQHYFPKDSRDILITFVSRYISSFYIIHR